MEVGLNALGHPRSWWLAETKCESGCPKTAVTDTCKTYSTHSEKTWRSRRRRWSPWDTAEVLQIPGGLVNLGIIRVAQDFLGACEKWFGSAVAQSHHWQLDYAQQCKPLYAINLGGWRESLRAINLSELGVTHYTPLIFGSGVQRSWPQAELVLRVKPGSLLVPECRAFITTQRWSAV